MGGGAWPFLVGGVICLVNSVNERDLKRVFRATLSFKGILYALDYRFLSRRKVEAITGL